MSNHGRTPCLKKITTFYLSLLTASIVILASCTTQSSIHGLWQDTKEAGTIEFKTNGEVIIIDNMSATVTGTFNIKENNLITFELTATDILKDSLQPIKKKEVSATIIKLNSDELEISFTGRTEIETYKRVN